MNGNQNFYIQEKETSKEQVEHELWIIDESHGFCEVLYLNPIICTQTSIRTIHVLGEIKLSNGAQYRSKEVLW